MASFVVGFIYSSGAWLSGVTLIALHQCVTQKGTDDIVTISPLLGSRPWHAKSNVFLVKLQICGCHRGGLCAMTRRFDDCLVISLKLS